MALILIRYILGISIQGIRFVILIMYILLGLVGMGLGKGRDFDLGISNHKSPLMAMGLPIIIGNV